MNGGWGISYEIALRWMPLDLIDDKSTLVQVIAWCHQATSHYLRQCWPRSVSPNGITRPQWVKAHVSNYIQEHFLWNCYQVNDTGHLWWKNQHWLRSWLDGIRHQAITWATVDPDPYGVTRPQHVNLQKTPHTSLMGQVWAIFCYYFLGNLTVF